MTTALEQRKMLECAAKACGFGELIFRNGADDDGYDDGVWKYTWRRDESGRLLLWNPITNALDTAEMCAELRISVLYEHDPCEFLACFAHNSHDPEIAHYKDHDNSRLRAWMFAATMVSAKTQGYEP